MDLRGRAGRVREVFHHPYADGEIEGIGWKGQLLGSCNGTLGAGARFGANQRVNRWVDSVAFLARELREKLAFTTADLENSLAGSRVYQGGEVIHEAIGSTLVDPDILVMAVDIVVDLTKLLAGVF